MSVDRNAPTARNNISALAIVIPVLIGAAAAVALGVYAKVHEPRYFSINLAGFSSPLAVKTWLATAVLVLGLAQLASALAIYGRIPNFRAPSWIGAAHVWTGRLAVLISVPVAIHCLYALGFQDYNPRVLLHSLFGCFFYGAFVAKMLLLTRGRLPGWVVPVAGGLVLAGLTGIWLSSAAWFFEHNGLTF